MIVSKHHVAPPARNKKNDAIIHTLRIKQKHLNLYKNPLYRDELEYSELLSCGHSDIRSRTLRFLQTFSE